MKENGIISVAALWIFLVLLCLGAAVLAISRSQRRAAEARFIESRSYLIAHRAAQLMQESNFQLDAQTFYFEGGHVDVERVDRNSDKDVCIRCTVHIGRYQKETQVEWIKQGQTWRAVTWREL